MWHMHIAAPLDDLQEVSDAQGDNLLRRELTESDGYKTRKHKKRMSGHVREHIFSDFVSKGFPSQIAFKFVSHPIAHSRSLPANAACDMRCKHDVFQSPQRGIRERRFGVGHIQNRSDVLPLGKNFAEICFINHCTARGIDEGCVWEHTAKEGQQWRAMEQVMHLD